MKTYWLLGIVLLIDITLLLVDDYFPGTLSSLGIPEWSLYALLGVLVLVSLLTHNPELEKRFRLHELILLAVYPMLVMILLTILGGDSESGLSVTSPFLWIFWGIILWLGWRDYQKEKEQDEQTLE
ncbi:MULTISPECIES: hypothetical protein [unclassified Planococcus (in: firmicutes)]|uniref:hypothetical protein n=1 Tax=unclassified Planococcus (in: firmicutes) TaxID=2662419 RepID=UPI000C32847C|nr:MULTISPECIES: hypothetical protein [unclassified Planococcus (in: firmicutes)]AUD14965.1 hypothetical protein CW734_16460 [Planococcus sp. MB-3u-03]PKG47096.1 hypothetical protein CXF66_04660 [Planococcus sp. Urea-trap-24]PKG87775.1 hypothetical protein CXF91_17550 [Planococcus sp. Urea-3u-39]PKH35433.1 hypothetical protein CXF77_17230 [Planococcus sp. MB-3u-09]